MRLANAARPSPDRHFAFILYGYGARPERPDVSMRLGRTAIQAPHRQPPSGDIPMPADTLSSAEDEVSAKTAKVKKAAKAAITEAAETSQEKLNEAIDVADKALRDAARRIEKAVR